MTITKQDVIEAATNKIFVSEWWGGDFLDAAQLACEIFGVDLADLNNLSGAMPKSPEKSDV